ncbi:MAG: hypothetical protein KC445_12570 [Anaerolineales bacterium]|nr:hypothetical protein [Anaerolineales bacterium]
MALALSASITAVLYNLRAPLRTGGDEYDVAVPPAAKTQQGSINVLSLLEEPNPVERLHFHPDGVHLASLLGRKAHWWNVETQTREAVFEPLP